LLELLPPRLRARGTPTAVPDGTAANRHARRPLHQAPPAAPRQSCRPWVDVSSRFRCSQQCSLLAPFGPTIPRAAGNATARYIPSSPPVAQAERSE
jgi:hypothetical protein